MKRKKVTMLSGMVLRNFFTFYVLADQTPTGGKSQNTWGGVLDHFGLGRPLAHDLFDLSVVLVLILEACCHPSVPLPIVTVTGALQDVTIVLYVAVFPYFRLEAGLHCGGRAGKGQRSWDVLRGPGAALHLALRAVSP